MSFSDKNGNLGLYQHFTIGKPMWKYWHLAYLPRQKWKIFKKWHFFTGFLGNAKTSTWVFLFGYVQRLAMNNIKQKNPCGSVGIMRFFRPKNDFCKKNPFWDPLCRAMS